MSSWPKEGQPKAAEREVPNLDAAVTDTDTLSHASVDRLIHYIRGLSECDEIEPITSGKVIVDRVECLVQILGAFFDIADRDDIHQAAQRLTLVQEWIRREAVLAATDPIFGALRLVS